MTVQCEMAINCDKKPCRNSLRIPADKQEEPLTYARRQGWATGSRAGKEPGADWCPAHAEALSPR